MRPRILFLDQAASLGGGELSLLDIARHFKATSKVILFEEGPFCEVLQHASIAAEVLPASSAVRQIVREGNIKHDLWAVPGVLKLTWKLAGLARNYDVFYANSQKAMVVAALAGWIARTPVIWHLRDLMTTEHFSRLHCWTATTLSNLFITRVLANSQATRNAYIACGGHASHVYTVYNGINSDRFNAVTRHEVESLRKSLGLNGVPVIGVFSRLSPWKGQHVLLEALAHVPNAHVLLVGAALFGADRRYEKMLKRQAKETGISDRVHFLGFRNDVPQLMHVVDMVVHSSITPEPFGRVIIEGMLAQKPVVATAAGGPLEIIEDGRTGILVPVGDAGQLAAALNRVFTDKTTAQTLALAGQQKALEQFSTARMLELITRHVEEVVVQS